MVNDVEEGAGNARASTMYGAIEPERLGDDRVPVGARRRMSSSPMLLALGVVLGVVLNVVFGLVSVHGYDAAYDATVMRPLGSSPVIPLGFPGLSPENNEQSEEASMGSPVPLLGASLPTINCPTSAVTFSTSLHAVYGSSIDVRLPRVEGCTPKIAGRRKCIGVGGNVVSTALPNPAINIQFNTPTIDGYSYCSVKSLVDELKSTTVTPAKVKDAACSLVGANSKVCGALNGVVGAVNSATQVVQQVPGKITDITAALDGFPGHLTSAMERMTDVIFGNMFPANPDVIVNALNGALGAAASASLGAAPPVQKDLFHPDHETTLRAHIRAALRGEDVPEQFKDIPNAYDLEEDDKTNVSSLGGSNGGLCVKFDTVMAENDLEEGYAADMPWPTKLAHDPRSPNSYTIKMPTMRTEACLRGKGGLGVKIPRKLAVDLIQGFTTFFKQIFTEGVDEVLQQVVEMKNHIKTPITAVTNQVNHLKGALEFRRRLRSDENDENDEQLEQSPSAALGESKLATMEEKLLRRVYEIRRAINDDPLLESYETQVARVPQSPSVATDEAELGTSVAGAMESAKDFFERTLRDGMQSVDFSQTLTVKRSIETTIKVSNGAFHEGDLLQHLGDEEARVTMDKLIPVAPPIMALLEFDGELRFPFFFQAVTNGEIKISASIEFELSFGMKDGKAISPTVSTPKVTYETPGSVSVSASIQIGAVFRLNNFYVGLCVGPAMCVGPRVTARQKVFVGFDAFAVAINDDAAAAGGCFNGKNTLETVFNDWDYAAGVKDECRLSKTGVAIGMGGYYQIPKTTLTVTVAQKVGLGYNIVRDFQVQGLIGSVDDNFVIGKLFHECSVRETGSRALEKCPCQETCPALALDPGVPAVADTNAFVPVAPTDDTILVIEKTHINPSAEGNHFWFWAGIGTQNEKLPLGSLLVQIDTLNTHQYGGAQYSESYGGLMSWYGGAGSTGPGLSEIALTNSGHATNGKYAYLRTREGPGYVALDFKTNDDDAGQMPVKFKFRQVISGEDTTLPLGPIAPVNEIDHASFFPVDLKLKTNEEGAWTDTGVEREDLHPGTYFVQVRSVSTHGNGGELHSETFSGLLSWYSGQTNSHDADEVSLHSAGRAANGCVIRLRTQRRAHTEGRAGLALQMATACESGASGTLHAQRFNFIFKLAVPNPLPPTAPMGYGVDEFIVHHRPLRLRNEWTSVGISRGDLDYGTYLVQIQSIHNYYVGGGMVLETASAILQWYPHPTNSITGSELVNMHMAGHAKHGGEIKLRFKESLIGTHPAEGLQIWSSRDTTEEIGYNFVFRLMIAPDLTDAQASCYLGHNPDLRRAFGNDLVAAKRHWRNAGELEGRNACIGQV